MAFSEALMNATDSRLVDEESRRRFEVDWAKGRPEPIEHYLPAADDPAYAGTLEELIHIELELAWRQFAQGPVAAPRPRLVEAYLLRFPCLKGPSELRLLQQEYEVRRRFDDCLGSADNRDRSPDILIGTTCERPFAQQSPQLDANLYYTAEYQAGDFNVHSLLAPPQGEGEFGRLERYRILKELGRGGMGIVLLAKDSQVRRLAALKIMLPHNVLVPGARERFLHEARGRQAQSRQHRHHPSSR
jgi:hypothetical protein